MIIKKKTSGGAGGFALLLAGALAAAVARGEDLIFIGTRIAEFNQGICLGFQNDVTDTTTTCYSSCQTAGFYIENIFDSTQYTNGLYNTAEMMYLGQVAQIYLIQQSKDCHFMEFLYALDNRFNDEAFTAGLLANVAMQAGLTLGYKVAMYYTYNEAYYNFYYLYQNTALVRLYNDLYLAYYAGDIE